MDQIAIAALNGIWAHDFIFWLQWGSLQGEILFGVLCLSLWLLPPVTWGTSVYRSRFLYGLLIISARACAGTTAGLSGEIVHKYTSFVSVSLLDVCSEILPHTTFWLFFNREHAAKIRHTYLKIYGLTWVLSLGRTPWVSQSELKPNVSVFRVYSFHKHITYAVCSCYPERIFPPGIWGICTFKSIFYW